MNDINSDSDQLNQNENVHVKNELDHRRTERERELGECGARRGGSRRHSDEHVALPVQGKVVRTREAAVTVWTLERFDSSVFSEMPCQFIGPSKLPRAPFPCTFVGFFSCMCSSVCFQVRAFSVHFVASVVITSVYPPLPLGVWRFHRQRSLPRLYYD